jgi:cytochrome c553
MTLKSILNKWAEELAAKAAQKDTCLQESTDAFKAVTAYYAAQQKTRKNQAEDEPEPGGFSFADEVGNGERQHPQVRTRRNS